MSANAEYIIVGGGLAGCALASRLADQYPDQVILLEAGVDASADARTKDLFSGFALAGSELDWKYKTVAQKELGDREVQNVAGKVLGGGSILNYGGWLRADSTDYEDWAKAVNDPSYNYNGFLPYFKKSETYCDRSTDPTQHGFDGPIHVSTISSNKDRIYGLKQSLQTAYSEIGIPANPDPTGNIAGICEFRENFSNGVRQPSNLAYGLKAVRVITNTLVQKVLFSSDSTPRATGVQTADGKEYSAGKEVILSAGTWRSPQLLLLSGIGPSDTLRQFSIPVIADQPAVGQGTYDHFTLFQFFKVRDPSKPLAMGNPHWTDAAYFAGLPIDWAVNDTVPADVLREAVDSANASTQDEFERTLNASALRDGRPLIKTMPLYAPVLPGVPVDGSLIATSIMLLAPRSRGQLSISSNSIQDHPVLDPKHYSSPIDRVALKYGVKRTLKALLGTQAGSENIEMEIPPPGMTPLTLESSDADIDARIRATAINHQHTMGGNAMGKVVDTSMRVKGVDGLRVVDASVFPVAVGGLPQATLYALAERAAETILGNAVGSA